MVITSIENNTIKSFSRLKDKKFRDEEKAYLIEGYRSVKDSVRFVQNPKLLFSESAFEKFGEEFVSYESIVCSDKVFSKISDTVSSQGVICRAEKREDNADYKCDKALFLDRVRDPGNMGTIIRTALASGFNDIYCYDCVDAFNPKVVRSAMSAVSRVRLFEANLATVSTIKEHGYKLLCADMDGENVFSLNDKFDKICIAIGNEANGISNEVFSVADKTISLPMLAGESLNAGVSASILMYMFSFGLKK